MIEMIPISKRSMTMKGVISLLKEKGVLYLTTPNRLHPSYKKFGDKLDFEELNELLKSCGDDIKFRVYGWNPFQNKFICRLIRIGILHSLIINILEWIMRLNIFDLRRSLNFFVIIEK
jgi:hypothetical protein